MKASVRVVGIALGIVLGLQMGCGKPESLWEKAEKGDANAQLELGLMYYEGEGVPKDSAEAVTWYRKAADQGLGEAQNNLGGMYANGEGVPKDYVEAYKWFTVAAQGGFATAEENQRNLALKMSGTQIVEALRLSREFRLKKTTP